MDGAVESRHFHEGGKKVLSDLSGELIERKPSMRDGLAAPALAIRPSIVVNMFCIASPLRTMREELF